MNEQKERGVTVSDLVLQTPKRRSHLSAWTEHTPFAFWVIETLRPRVLVELGSHAGVSFAAFCQAADAIEAPMRAIAIDTWAGDEHTLARPDAYNDDVYSDLKAYIDAHHRRAELWRMTFDEAVAQIADGSIDLLHIDGLHTYEAVRHDFETWRSKLSDRGVVLFHDTAERGGDFGVWRFWEEIASRWPSFLFEHGHGLGVLAYGPNAAAIIDQLNAAPDRARALFSRLGRAISAEDDLALSEERLRTATDDAAEHLHNAQNAFMEIRLRDAEIGRRDAEIGKRDAEMGRLEADRNAHAAALSQTRQHADALQAALTGVLASTSWKVTAPLRKAGRLLGTLRRSWRGWRALTLTALEERGGVARWILTAPAGAALSGWALLRIEADQMAPLLRIEGGPEAGRAFVFPPFTAKSANLLLRLPDVLAGLMLEAANFRGTKAPKASLRLLSQAEAMAQIAKRKPSALREAVALGREKGAKAALEALAAPYRSAVPSDYERWVQFYDTPTKADLDRQRVRIEALSEKPTISIVTPVYNTPPAYLAAMLNSVRAQSYPHWELCVADDCSPNRAVRDMLSAAAREDKRIKLTLRAQNGNISAASNSALETASGGFTALLDHDDVLPPHALATAIESIAAYPRADIFYSDEDKLDQNGVRFDPYFKPDWNEELLYAQNYVSHLGVYRTDLIRDVGGFRLGFEGSQDYDLLLRAAAKTRGPIVHIPHILYHWRVFPGAETFSSTQLSRATAAARQAIIEHLAGQGVAATMSDGPGGYHRLHRPEPANWPKVTAIVPTRDHVDVLRPCVEGLLGGTDYPDIELIVVDNDSADSNTLNYLAEIAKLDNARVITVREPFNFSRLNNIAAREAKGDVLLLLNNDISMLSSQWLKEMVVHAIRDDVGAVGARLLYPDGTVQHGGVVLGMGGVAGHVHRLAGGDDPGYFARLKITQEISCVTGACLAIRKSVFNEIGGLDEANLAVAFNDVDLCLRITEAGYKIIWTPHAELVHWESKSRGYETQSARFIAETEYMRKRWTARLARDPFFSPNHDLMCTTPQLAAPPRIQPAWAAPTSGL